MPAHGLEVLENLQDIDGGVWRTGRFPTERPVLRPAVDSQGPAGRLPRGVPMAVWCGMYTARCTYHPIPPWVHTTLSADTVCMQRTAVRCMLPASGALGSKSQGSLGAGPMARHFAQSC